MTYSIILPVRNGGAYVKECIQSILEQTLADFNLHVLDNCSTDGTTEWIASLTDPRIVLYRSETSLSIEENWDRILNIPKNQFITLIGHDDLLHPNYLQTMQQLIQKHPGASLYQTHFIFIDGKGSPIRACQPMAEIQNAAGFLSAQFTQTLDSMGTGYMMRSRDFEAAGGMTLEYPNLIFADYALWVKLILTGFKATAAATAFSYRVQDSNVSKLTNGEEYTRAFGVYMHFLARLRKKDDGVAEALNKHGKQMLLYFCESLSHRLLKTPREKRVTSVAAYIANCRQYAAWLIPGQSFNPMLRPRIFVAALLDNKPGIAVFKFIKKLSGA